MKLQLVLTFVVSFSPNMPVKQCRTRSRSRIMTLIKDRVFDTAQLQVRSPCGADQKWTEPGRALAAVATPVMDTETWLVVIRHPKKCLLINQPCRTWAKITNVKNPPISNKILTEMRQILAKIACSQPTGADHIPLKRGLVPSHR